MARRLDFHEKLVEFLGSRNVYFQPPESIKLVYPCIVYKRVNADSEYANNLAYLFTFAYEVTFISRDPDSECVERMAWTFPMSRYNRHFVADNLNHDVFTIYY